MRREMMSHPRTYVMFFEKRSKKMHEKYEKSLEGVTYDEDITEY